MKGASSFTAQPRVSNCTILPNEVYQLKLSATAFAVYSYLRRLADPETHQCWPSYANIAETFGCSKRTVAKYVAELCDAGLVSIEATSVTTADGLKWNGNLRYTILPILNAVDLFHERQLTKLGSLAQKKRKIRRTAKRKSSGGSGCEIRTQDKKRWSQAPPSRPQSPAMRGFPGTALGGR